MTSASHHMTRLKRYAPWAALALIIALTAEVSAWGLRKLFDSSARPLAASDLREGDRPPSEWSQQLPSLLAASGFTILCIGDSFTYGAGVNAAGAYPAQLERLLDRQFPAVNLRVVNAGWPGYNAVTEARIMLELLPLVKPQVVLWQLYRNDVEPMNDYFGKTMPKYALWSARLARHSYLCLLWYNRFVVPRLAKSYEQRLKSFFDPGSEEWQKMLAALQSVAQSLGPQSVKPYVFVYPPIDKAGPQTRREQSQLESAARDAGLAVTAVDPAMWESRDDLPRYWVSPENHHPSAAAHAEMAEKLLQFSQISDLIRAVHQ